MSSNNNGNRWKDEYRAKVVEINTRLKLMIEESKKTIEEIEAMRSILESPLSPSSQEIKAGRGSAEGMLLPYPINDLLSESEKEWSKIFASIDGMKEYEDDELEVSQAQELKVS